MAERSDELGITNKSDNGSGMENGLDNYGLSHKQDVQDDESNETVSNDTSEDTAHIRGKIEETRREMGETIDAIQEKLSISNISEQVKEQVSEQINNAVETAKGAVYDATIRKAGEFMQNVGKELKKSNIVKTAGENPLPFVLIGLGAGLLLFKNYNKRPSYKKNGGFKGKSEKSSFLKSAQNKVTEAASQTYENVSQTANSAYDTVSHAAASAYKSLGSTAHDTYGKAGELGTQVREKYDYYLEENPLAIGAVALALGAAVGLAIPSTQYENELLGEAHENLMLKAEDMTRQVTEKVQQVAGEVKKTISGEGEAQNQV